MTDSTQQGNLGIRVIVNVVNADGSAKDLTGATNILIKLKSRLATVGKSFAAEIYGDATDGAVSCVLDSADDLDDLSIWQAQAYYEQGEFKGHTRPADIFIVEGNLA